MAEVEGHSGPANSWIHGRGGWMFASGRENGTVVLWEGETGRVSQTLVGHTDRVNCLSFGPAGQDLVSGGQDQTLRFWKVSGGRETCVFCGFTGSITACAVSPAGECIVLGDSGGRVLLCRPIRLNVSGEEKDGQPDLV